MVRYATQFHTDKQLAKFVEVADFIKGVLYFWNPTAIDLKTITRNTSPYVETLDKNSDGTLRSCPEVHVDRLNLTGLDIACIKRHRAAGRFTTWKHLSTSLRLIQTACALAAITQGWDQSAMNAANLGWPTDLNLPIKNIMKDPSENNAWLFGLINGAPFFSGSVVGFLFTDPFSNNKVFGRRLVLLIAGLFSFASVVGSAGAETWQDLLACRLLLGIGMGTKASIVRSLKSLIRRIWKSY